MKIMSNTIILVNDLYDINSIEKQELENSKVFSFSIEGHKNLEKQGISHQIAENYLSENERLKVFDIVVSFHEWYKEKNEFKELEYDGINLLGLLDTVEFHTHLMEEIINFFTTKRIIEKEKPDKIITTEKFSEIIKILNQKNHIELKINHRQFSKKLQWEEITIKQNIGNFPISFTISRSKYSKIKHVWEKIVCSIFNLWFNFKKSDQKTILFLEFYPPLYEELILKLQKNGFNIIFLNRRKPAVFDFKSIKLLRRSGGTIINYDDLLNAKQKTQIELMTDAYVKKLNNIFSNNQLLSNIFSIDGYSLWNILKEKLIENYKTRIGEYLFLLITTKKIFEQINISCILTLNEIGETEKSILAVNKNQIPSIVLEHGFSTFFPDTARFNILASYPNFKDKISVWSTFQKNFLIDFHKISPEQILVTGSPRHDSLFKQKLKYKKKQFTVLIAPTPITQIQGFDDTNIHLKFESILRKLCSVLQKNHDIKIIVKIHPSQSYHNKIIQEIIKKFDQNISIHLLTSVTKLIESSDAIITITPEGWAPSTIILESMIMKKPIMNIILDNHFYDFPYIKEKAVLIVSPESNLDENISKLLINKEFREKLIINGENFVMNFLHKPGHASECLANEINSLKETN